ncbi:sensor histidine kinase [Salinimicrobium flavum]|uniref:histidine kinase n=1 Tax=Salinimicrobium flavum TaxID=1737065 RepID=A0ABW5IY97_9FLAO
MREPKFQDKTNQDLEDYQILRTAPNKEFSDIIFLAAQICHAPATAMILIQNGEAVIKAIYGMDPGEISPKDVALLQQEENKRDQIYLADQFSGNFNSSKFSHFTGVPVTTNRGNSLGVLIALYEQPQDLKEDQKVALNALSRQILNLVEFRKQRNEFKNVRYNLEQKYHDLERFASVVSHDIKSPLANIISLTELLKEENKEIFNEESRQYLDFLGQASQSLRSYVDGLLVFYRSDKILERKEEDVDLFSYFRELRKLFPDNPSVEINYPLSGKLSSVNKAALTQIFLNLLSNALKYNDKPFRRIDINFSTSEEFFLFEVKDNGNGIPENSIDKIFGLFTTLEQNDRDGNPGSGIGLATVKKMVEHMGGDIQVESKPGEGSSFKFKIKR